MGALLNWEHGGEHNLSLLPMVAGGAHYDLLPGPIRGRNVLKAKSQRLRDSSTLLNRKPANISTHRSSY